MGNNDTDPLDPSGIAQFVEHDRCPRYLKQRVDPGEEPDARDWREAYGLMNIALLGNGREFEADQLERLAANAGQIIGPELDDQTKTSIPDIPMDETWADSTNSCTAHLTTAIERAASLIPADDEHPYIFLYQVPLSGTLGKEPVYGDADCLALAPADAVPTPTDTDPAVVFCVIDCKSAEDEQPAHRVRVTVYCALLEQTLTEVPCDIDCHIQANVLTQTHATTTNEPHSPFDLPTFRRPEWELFVTQLLGEDGPVAATLADDLQDLPFALDQVCNNCAYREACTTRAIENPRDHQSLAMLGLDASTQLTLEERLPILVHELVLRAQALDGDIEPEYPEHNYPPATSGNEWVPLPGDRCTGWNDIDSADPGELINVALFVRPDSVINRIGALGEFVGDGGEHADVPVQVCPSEIDTHGGDQ